MSSQPRPAKVAKGPRIFDAIDSNGSQHLVAIERGSVRVIVAFPADATASTLARILDHDVAARAHSVADDLLDADPVTDEPPIIDEPLVLEQSSECDAGEATEEAEENSPAGPKYETGLDLDPGRWDKHGL